MCGILFTNDPKVNRARFEIALKKMEHRGPDNLSVLESNGMTFGHARLSIINLSDSANQPMTSDSGRSKLVFNGEIYNFKYLAQKYNISNRNSDSKVLLELLELKGASIISEVDGMFAFVFVDEYHSKFYYGRDSLGIKPLYKFNTGDSLYLCSEIKPLAYLVSEYEICKRSLYEYLQFNTTLGKRTLYRNIEFVEPGIYDNITGDKLSIDKNNEEISEEKSLRQELIDTVESHLVSDLPMSLFLSSGLDSNLLLIITNLILGREVTPITLGFDHSKSSEHKTVEKSLNKLGIKGHTLIVNLEEVESDFYEYFSNKDYPSLDGFNNYLITKKARKSGFKVGLSGLGGDELTFGYPHMRKALIYWNNRNLIRGLGSRSLGHKINKSFKLDRFQTDFTSLSEFYSLLKGSNYAPGSISRDVVEIFESVSIYSSDKMNIKALEIASYTQPILLRDADIASMMNSFEMRVPFFSKKLVSKCILENVSRKSMIQSFRQELESVSLARIKKGFTLPYETWVDKIVDENQFKKDKKLIENLYGDYMVFDNHALTKLKLNSLSRWIMDSK